MTGEAMKQLIDTLQAAAMVEEKEFDGRKYTSRPVHLVKLPRPDPLEAGTLGAVVDYLAENRDGLDHKQLTVHIVHERSVQIVGRIDLQDMNRPVYLRATPMANDLVDRFVNRYLPTEEFCIGLMTLFAPDPAGRRAGLLAYAGNLVEAGTLELNDGGASVTATVQKSLVNRKDETFVNPAALIARQSFPEIVLGPRDFIFRLQRSDDDGNEAGVPQAALFEADAGVWKLDAMAKIAAWLRMRLAEKKLDGEVGLIV